MALQAGDLVLVTGVNGFIASHIADQCLRVGFKVRGTVRDINKARWMYELFNKQYGIGQFEAVVVESMEKTEAFHEATKGTRPNISYSRHVPLILKETTNLEIEPRL